MKRTITSIVTTSFWVENFEDEKCGDENLKSRNENMKWYTFNIRRNNDSASRKI